MLTVEASFMNSFTHVRYCDLWGPSGVGNRTDIVYIVHITFMPACSVLDFLVGPLQMTLTVILLSRFRWRVPLVGLE